MRRTAAPAAVLVMTIGLSACGKYGPPVRSVPQQAPATFEAPEAEAPQPVPWVPEERITEPADFDDSPAEEENGP
jgi:hypothetical protein